MKAKRRDFRRVLRVALCAAMLAFLLIVPCAAADQVPDLTVDTDADIFPFNLLGDLLKDTAVEDAGNTIELILLLTVLSLVPSILIMMTSFTRIVIILSFTRNALGTQAMPPNQVLIGLALFLTYFTMHGTLEEINEKAWKPYNSGEITEVNVVFENAVEPLRDFMIGQIELQENAGDLQTFMTLAGIEPVESTDQIPTYVLIPAFITSEIKVAFSIGFFIFVPFIVIDMVVASALMSMGMMMLPPVMISLPFKIMIFVLFDGWNRVVQMIVTTFMQ